jgi:secreted trypsin-like serine protease
MELVRVMPSISMSGPIRIFLVMVLAAITNMLSAHTAGVEDEQRNSDAIVNGSPPAIAHPWMVAIVFNSSSGRPTSQLQSCGGTLVAPDWVITAAHCVSGRFPYELSVFIGRDNLDLVGGENIPIQEFILHPDWHDGSPDADIALLRLAEASVYEPVSLAPQTLPVTLAGSTLQLLGWGSTFDDQNVPCELTLDDGGNNDIGYLCKTLTYQPTNQPSSLQQAAVQLQSLQTCFDRTVAAAGLADTAEHRAQFQRTFSRSLCGWEAQDAQAACFGDSGGPLLATVDGRQYLVGVTSQILLAGCPVENQITWFVDVASFHGFLEEAMSRDASLGMAALCPEPVRPVAEYGETVAGLTPLVLRWPAARRARHYTLYFAALDSSEDIAGSRQFTADTLEFSATLTSGDHYLVALRASSTDCDGPLSSTLELQVP